MYAQQQQRQQPVLSATNNQEWIDKQSNTKVQFTYSPEKPLVSGFTELKFNIKDSKRGRSNAIALGVLVYHFKINFNQAMELIISKVPICNILPPHISALQKLLNTKAIILTRFRNVIASQQI